MSTPSALPSTQATFRFATLTAAVLIAQQVAAKATRDALFLGELDASHLPVAMLAGAAASLAAVVVFTRILRVYGPGRLVPYCLGLSAFLYICEWQLASLHPVAAAWTIYVHLAIFGGIALSGFWSIFGELFDPHTAKKYIGKVGAGATLGGVLGAFIAERLTNAVDVRDNLLLLSLLHIVGASLLFRLAKPISDSPKSKRRLQQAKAASGGIQLIWNSNYLILLGLLVTLAAAIAALTDFAFKAEASTYFHDKKDLLRFFAAFYAITSLLTFLTQTFLTHRALSRLGLGGTLVLLPGAVVILSITSAVTTRLATVMALRGLSTALENSMHRSGYELLYTPLAPSKKRAAKTIIDVAFDRFGDAIGASLVLLVLATMPLLAPKIAIILAGLLALLCALVAWRLHGGYVSALVSSLKSGSLNPDKLHILDATTQRTINDTTMALDRDRLLEEISRFRAKNHPTDSPNNTDYPPTTLPTHSGEPLLKIARTLLGDKNEKIEALLQRPAELPPELGPLVIRLLAIPALEQAAKDALIFLAPQIIGQLHDGILSNALPLAARRKLPAILRTQPSPRSVVALTDALTVERFDLRYRVAQSLVLIQREDPALVSLDRMKIYDLVLQELNSVSASTPPSAHHHSTESEMDDSLISINNSLLEDSPGWLSELLQRRLHKRVEHAFALLSLVHKRNPLELSLLALFGEDEILRGTALEYLENVLPPNIIAALRPYIHHESPASQRSIRQHDEILSDLLKSTDSLRFDPSLLNPKN